MQGSHGNMTSEGNARANSRSEEQKSDSRQCRWDEQIKDGKVFHPAKAIAAIPAEVRGRLSGLTWEVWRVFGRISFAAATRSDCFARSDDRTSDVSRGHSRMYPTGEGLRALKSKSISKKYFCSQCVGEVGLRWAVARPTSPYSPHDSLPGGRATRRCQSPTSPVANSRAARDSHAAKPASLRSAPRPSPGLSGRGWSSNWSAFSPQDTNESTLV